MIPTVIRAEHVRAAIEEIDRSGVPWWRQPLRYHLVYEGRRYPPKYVVSLAARHATGRALPSKEFNGGSETNSFLRSLGFEVTGPATKPLPADPDLETVVDEWYRLPEAVRKGIVAMVKAASMGSEADAPPAGGPPSARRS